MEVILKKQESINPNRESINEEKVKNISNDFKNIQEYIEGYGDRYNTLPGDDSEATHRFSNARPASPSYFLDNVLIDGAWDSLDFTDESVLFWQHVRLANLAIGPIDLSDESYLPTNINGGRIGVQSMKNIKGFSTIVDSDFVAKFVICSDRIEGKLAQQVDVMLDDGISNTGRLRMIESGSAGFSAPSIDMEKYYTVCQLAF